MCLKCVAGHNERITHKNRHKISCDSHDREARLLQLILDKYIFIIKITIFIYKAYDNILFNTHDFQNP